MAEIDKVKEQVGWLKVAFGLLVVIGVSLIAWIAQNLTTANTALFFLAVMALVFVIIAVVAINHSAQKKIDRLGDL